MMEKGKSEKATWDAVAHRVFLDVCIEEVRENNRPTGCLNPIGYANLVSKFNDRTKRKYERKQFKNRWESLKKDYNLWKSLNQYASGLGRDPVTKTIAASDDCWEKEIKRCPDAAKFRHVPLEDEEKMREIFHLHSVTNEHARVPPPSQVNLDAEGDSGCELDDESSPVQPRLKKLKKKLCPYSPSCTAAAKIATESSSKMALERMVEILRGERIAETL